MFGIYARQVIRGGMFGSLEKEPEKKKKSINLAKCGECGKHRVKLVYFDGSSYPYDKDYGPRWVCQGCKAHVGCHPNSTRPLGTTAGPETSRARRNLRYAFDALWKSKFMTRPEAYKWLQSVMRLPHEKAHIAMFTKEQCWKAQAAVYTLTRFQRTGRK